MLAPGSVRTQQIFERNPVRAAEADIRAYLFQHRLIPKAETMTRAGNGRMMICFLGVYAALALIVTVAMFFVNRMDCDPMFTDRGLTAACRDWSGNAGRLVGADTASRGPALQSDPF